MSTTITQYRFFWPHADDDMLGATWQDRPFSEEQIKSMNDCGFREWWIEKRTVTCSDPVRV